MQITSLILGIVIGVVIATPFAWFIGKQRSVLLQGKVQSLEERNTPPVTPSQPTTVPTVEPSPQPSNPRRLW